MFPLRILHISQTLKKKEQGSMFWNNGVNPSNRFRTLENECQIEMTLFWRMLHDVFLGGDIPLGVSNSDIS